MSSQRTQRKIIIIGGTGKQGSAVINALLSSKSAPSLYLATLTRNPQAKKALELKERGVELVQIDLDEVTVDHSVFFQLAGADGLFVAQAISDKEVEEGRTIINAAEKAGVEQVVYSSVGQAHDAPYPGALILRFSILAQAFLNPEKYDRQSIELAADKMNGHQLSQTFSKVLGRPMKYEKMKPRDESSRLMVQWIENNNFLVDVEALKKEHELNLKSVEDFIKDNKHVFE
ncbi:unnamed protein product [Didymodactylos carnosus]|uniref:NmrA-like family domain-containing protein 1 n=1 Tax=Didymodactylos carnosus TaxID=1234261 RepID=A0A815HVU5_9BILA|nr:unnamed protein product [Didymodactylos carnosus]CAF4236361.1 unnamed protein product [Didymodactylos carnosus]